MRYKVYPGTEALVQGIREGGREFDTFIWGFRPHWCPKRHAQINARAETLRTSRMFGKAFAKRRCLVPATGFYEPLRNSSTKRYFHFERPNKEPFCFAGIWTYYNSGEDVHHGLPYKNFAIITTEANNLMRPIHQRMPVIVPPEHYAEWIDPKNHDVEALQRLLSPAEDELLEGYEVASDLYMRPPEDFTILHPIGERFSAGRMLKAV